MHNYIKWLIKHNIAFVVYLMWILYLPIFIVAGCYLGVREALCDWIDDRRTIKYEVAEFKKSKEVK